MKRATDSAAIARALEKPGISPEELIDLDILPVGRNSLYDALKRGDIQSFRVGKKIVIPTAPLKRQFGLS